MFKAKPPFKLAVAGAFLQGEELCAADVVSRLAPEYPGEKIFCVSNVASALQSLKAVGILKVTKEEQETMYFSLTKSGWEKVGRAMR